MNLIESYSFGSITINGQTYHEDLIVFPGKIKRNWRRKEGHNLFPSDLKDVFSFEPEILVIGKGANGIMKFPDSTKKEIEEKGIKVIAQNTGKAFKTFNKRLKEGKKVIGAFHLTC